MATTTFIQQCPFRSSTYQQPSKTLVLDVSQAIGFVPSGGKDVERNLSADGIGKVVISELLLQNFYKGSSDAVDLLKQATINIFCDECGANLVVSLELVAFRDPEEGVSLECLLCGMREHTWHFFRWD